MQKPLGFLIEQRVHVRVVKSHHGAHDERQANRLRFLPRLLLDGRQPKTLSLIWLKSNLPPTDWGEQQVEFDEFDAKNGFVMFLVSAVAAQPSARKPHEIEGASIGQPQVKLREERILGAGAPGRKKPNR